NVTTAFNEIQSRTWPPPIRSPQASGGRTLSPKVLVNVIEALIGATFSDTDGSRSGKERHPSPRFSGAADRTSHFDTSADPASNIDAERLIGRTFDQKTLLLKALTLNPAGSQIHVESYQRLEFPGNTVFDLLVVTRPLRDQQSTNTLTQGKLIRLRAALVNAHLLGYFNLHFRLSLQSSTAYTNPETGDFQITTLQSHVSIWHFLSHDFTDLTTAQQECVQQHQNLSASLLDALEYSDSYPWETLLALALAKFHSDMIESVIGAISVDSGGQLQPCEDFLTRIGLMEYLERLIGETSMLYIRGIGTAAGGIERGEL
ncbi:Dicer-like protein 2, partial [Friedmanniomyces endolithicus]